MGAPGKGPFECCGKIVCQDQQPPQDQQPHPPAQAAARIQQQDNQNNNVLPEQPQDHQNNNHIYVNPTANYVDTTTTTTTPSLGSISVPHTASRDDDDTNNNNGCSLSRQLTSTTLNTYLFPLDLENNNNDKTTTISRKPSKKFNLFAKLTERIEPKISEEVEKEKEREREKEKKKSSGPPKAVRAQAGRQMDNNDPLQGRQRKVTPAKGKKSKDKEKDFYKDLEKYTQHFNLNFAFNKMKFVQKIAFISLPLFLQIKIFCRF